VLDEGLSKSGIRTYESTVTSPADLDDFWQRTLAETRSVQWPTRAEPVDTGLQLVRTSDVTFSGHGGAPIRAWYHRPAGDRADGRPTIVRFQGYGGGRGLSHQVSPLVLAGYALLEVDTRGQGSGYSPGDTADPSGSDPAHPGYLTRGILSPETYYYRRVFADAVRAVEVAQQLSEVGSAQIAVLGSSQGAGIALAAAALTPGLGGVLADVPFLADFRRAAEVSQTPPYTELSNYLAVHPDHVEQAFLTLAYFDVAVLGRQATAPALFSVALKDQTCPPSTVYAAYNSYAGRKRISVYPFNDHEGGHAFHEAQQLRWLLDTLPPG
jgi:cephalosporin-C deacetylase